VGGALIRFGYSLARVTFGAQHPIEAEIWPSEKFYLGGYTLDA